MLEYQRDPLYLRYYPWEDRSEADARAFVDMFLYRQSEPPSRRFQLGIARREDGRLIGNCGIRRKPDTEWESDIGYGLSPRYRGCGYAMKAARVMVDFGSVTWAYSASRPGASSTTLHRPGCWGV